MIIGIRREDKNRWERRVPLVPADLTALQDQGLAFRIQPSANRIFTDDEYHDSGCEVAEDLAPCDLILAVKEIPTDLLERGKAYVFFSHVIKGQDYNMPMLRRLLELDCTLIDYEKICDPVGRRLIFFSIHAGQAGMIDSLWTLGRRLAALGHDTPLAEIRMTHEYPDFEAAKAHLREVGARLDGEMPAALRPLVIGVVGYGNVASGCREVLDCLPCEWISPVELPSAAARDAAAPPIRCVEFREEHMAQARGDEMFDLDDYYANPERYAPGFQPHLEHLDVLMNTIYWDRRYPRLVTRAWARDHRRPRLQVIGDISCDIEGSVEITLTATMPDQPSFTYDRDTDAIVPGVEGDAPVVMAVDNLPCELPRESSEHFSSVLASMVPAVALCDWSQPFDDLALPPALKTAVIVHRGELTPDYHYLVDHLNV